jgi:23S rRNA (adenine1618-N6)-methyltransferase
MPEGSTPITTEKENLHPRNLHRQGYDFDQLVQSSPELGEFVKQNQYHNLSIDFADPQAVIALNKALLKHFYHINYWEIPEGYLCPPIPGRADYIHYMADVLAACNNGIIPTGPHVNVLDIGTGANCIYPIIGNSVYGWQFVATDIDPAAIRSAKQIIAGNAALQNAIDCRLQFTQADVFKGIIKPGEAFDLVVCNPPFHSSRREAHAGNTRKWNNLNRSKLQKVPLNFGGTSNELWVAGGESAFINRMVNESALFADSCLWFSTLVSKKETLANVYKALDWVKAADVKTINMAQGQKISRVVAWTFLNEEAQANWQQKHWQK